ncbi:PAS domain-containing protein [Patescibacteria group bacterium]|nr:PAS domain-containing protein [Patescibacteria group bacterium]
MNKLLKRQIKKYLKMETCPEEAKMFLEIISETYDGFDQDRDLMERSLDISSREHIALVQSLKESDERYKIVVKQTGQMIYDYDVVTGKISWFGAISEITGLSEKEISNFNIKKWEESIHPEDRGDALNELEKAMNSVGNYKVNYRFKIKSGKYINIEDEGLFISEQHNGKATRMYGVMKDITERKRSEEKIKQSLSLISATLESTGDGILVVDMQGKWAHYNNKFLELWKIPSKIAESKNDKLALDYVIKQLKDPKRFIDKVMELYSKPKANSFDIIKFKDGRIFERYSQPQILGNEVVGRVWSFRDATERIKAEAAMKASEKKLKNEIEKIEFMGQMGLKKHKDMIEMKRRIKELEAQVENT